MDKKTRAVVYYAAVAVAVALFVLSFVIEVDWLLWVGLLILLGGVFFEPRGRGLGRFTLPADEREAARTKKSGGLWNKGDEDD